MASKITAAFLFIACLSFVASRSAPRIVGGDEAEPHEFPYQISLQWVFTEEGKEPMHFCGGSLISANYILTAAHCRTSYSKDGFIEAVAAEHDVLFVEGSEQRRAVASFVIHERYGGGVGPNDIAVIRVDRPFQLNEQVKTVQLPKQYEQFEGDVVLSGWGSISTTAFPDYPDKLRKAVLPLVSYERCVKLWNDVFGTIAKSNVCAGPEDGSKSACSADSGGPLVKQIGEDLVQVGVVSWGAVPCGSPRHPTVFVGVSHFIDWIEKHTQQ